MSGFLRMVVNAGQGPNLGDLVGDEVSPEELKRRLEQIVAVCSTASVKASMTATSPRKRWIYQEAVNQVHELATGVRRLPTLRRL